MEHRSTDGMKGKDAKVVHLTSVHPPFDNRIFHKQCRTLAESGYEVVLVAPADQSQVRDGVRIRAVPRAGNRFARMLLTTWRVFLAGLAEKGDIYHFHDPELIPVALLLRALGKRVVYDVHEDNVTSIMQKRYLPRIVRMVLAKVFGWFELVASRAFTVVLAERYYSRRFPAGVQILNYPRRDFFEFGGSALERETIPESVEQTTRLIYTGSVTIDRGALIYAKMVAEMPNISITVVGQCSPELAAEMRRVAGDGASRLEIIGEGTFVPFSEIAAIYRSRKWTAGLAIFPETPHYVEKELTKFFEYMAAGIPILASNFPAWRQLIEGNGVGLCVDPEDMGSIRGAIEKLARDEGCVIKMGHNGRRAVAERFNWDVEGKKLLNLYDKLMMA